MFIGKIMKKIDLLDTTLRDGNYAVDFQFTALDTATIALALEKAGFRWIEIGHGLGLNASRMNRGVAAATDEEYLKAAAGVLEKAMYGMFFIPGIGRERDIRMARDSGMSFIRVGTNADSIIEARTFIRLAKKLGFTVFSNLMKSYTLDPAELSDKARIAEDFGADIICVVDSAGGMLPEDVERYFNQMRRKVSCALGFHGHDNLSLAVANTLEAIKYGATIVDGSLQGIGRSGGNAPTETLSAILNKKNMLKSIDIRKTMDAGGKLVRPFFHKYGISPIDVTLGYAQFHSSFMDKIREISEKHGIDERELIMRVSSVDRISPTSSLIEAEAKRLKNELPPAPTRPFIIKRIKVAPKDFVSGKNVTPRSVVRQIRTFSKRTGKLGILNIVFSTTGSAKSMKMSPFIQESFSYVVGTAEVSNANQVKKLAGISEGAINYVLFDSTCMSKIKPGIIRHIARNMKKTGFLLYNDYRAWINAVAREASQLVCDPHALLVAVFGDADYTVNTAIILAEMGCAVTLHVNKKDKAFLNSTALRLFYKKGMVLDLDEDAAQAARDKDVIIGFSPGRQTVTMELAEKMKPAGVIVDAGLGSVAENVIPFAHKRNIKVIRVDMRPVIAGEITSSIGVKQLIDTHIGMRKIKGKTIVSGGYIGKKGDIVVDSVKETTKVIGVARGNGIVEYANLGKYKKDIEKIEKEILTNRVS